MTLPVVQSVDADGVGWIVFDDPAGRANILNPATRSALHAALDALAAAPVKAVVLTSAQEGIFIAGADLQSLGQLADTAAAEALSREGQGLFDLVANFKAPVVCAIHGECVGGGFELALACDWRVASEAKETQIGLPEVGLGLIPGWGGCARLPRLIGAAAALDHIVEAAAIPAAVAVAAGLIDAVAPAAELKARAKAAALKLAAEGRPPRTAPAAAGAEFFASLRRSVTTRMRGQPAPLAAIAAVERGAGVSLAEALAVETAQFGAVAAGGEAKNLLRVFALKEAARKRSLDAWFPGTAAPKVEPPTVIGMVGAGVMGAGIGQTCAEHGLGVMMTDASAGVLKMGVEVVRGLFAEAVRRGRLSGAAAHKAMGSISISMDCEDFCVCDFVIEAVVENLEVKQGVFAEVAKVLPEDCVIASNSSALPIEAVAAKLPHPERAVGLHFFPPVDRMPLAEIALGPQTSRATAERALAVARALGKTPVVCRSSPGFFVTRVLFFYLNAACRLWEEGVPAEAIDGAMCDWGWRMGPLRLIDEIGTDVADCVGEELKKSYPDRFAPAAVCHRMVEAGWRGRKNGESAGFYTYGEPGEALNAAVAPFRAGAERAMAAAEIQRHLLGVLIDEAERALQEGVLRSADDADLALILGAGFPAVRGGLIRRARGTAGGPA